MIIFNATIININTIILIIVIVIVVEIVKCKKDWPLAWVLYGEV